MSLAEKMQAYSVRLILNVCFAVYLYFQVECSPLCSIDWIVGDEIITEEDEQFTVEEQDLEEDIEKNQFMSVISTLTWLQLDRTEENFTVECR